MRCPQLQRPRGLEGSIQTQAPALDTAGITDDAHVGNFSGPRLAQLAPFIRSCFIGRISYLAPTSSRIMGSAAVRRSTSVWSFPEKIDSPHPPLWDHLQGRDTRSNQLRPGSEGSRREPS